MTTTSSKAGQARVTRASSPVVVSIVVNFRGLAETRVCVASLLAVDYADHEIVIVDNDSGGGEAAALEGEFGGGEFAGRVRVIASERNLGYGGAANLGLELARRDGPLPDLAQGVAPLEIIGDFGFDDGPRHHLLKRRLGLRIFLWPDAVVVVHALHGFLRPNAVFERKLRISRERPLRDREGAAVSGYLRSLEAK